MEFIHDKINYPYFTEEDLERTVGKRLNKGTPSASTIKSELLNGIYFNNETMKHYTTKLVQRNFLNKLKQQIEDGEGKVIIEDLYRMAKILGTSNNSFLNLAGDARELTAQYGADVSVLGGLFNASSVKGSEEWLRERYQVRREHQYRASPGSQRAQQGQHGHQGQQGKQEQQGQQGPQGQQGKAAGAEKSSKGRKAARGERATPANNK